MDADVDVDVDADAVLDTGTVDERVDGVADAGKRVNKNSQKHSR